MIEVGKPAPEFSLPATGPKTLAPKGTMLLAFFPAAFTPAAAADLVEIERRSAEIRAKKIEPAAISVDSVWANQIFSASLGGLSFPLAGDLKRDALKAFGALRADGLCERALVLVRDGKISFSKALSPGDKLPIDEAIDGTR